MTERGFPIWEELYRTEPGESLPWYYAALDPDLERTLRQHAITEGRFLDLGTGPGTQALALAERGFEVVGSDLSEAAVESATARAAGQRRVRFVKDDILNTALEPGFDWVLDRGCFHVFGPEWRDRYVQTLAALIRPGGLLFVKCFSTEQPGDTGPYRFSAAEIITTFAGSFEVLSSEPTVYHGTLVPLPKALFTTLRRLE
jgi:SAM-dependent methyltransferase